jgi:hypothetical protein
MSTVVSRVLLAEEGMMDLGHIMLPTCKFLFLGMKSWINVKPAQLDNFIPINTAASLSLEPSPPNHSPPAMQHAVSPFEIDRIAQANPSLNRPPALRNSVKHIPMPTKKEITLDFGQLLT